MGPDLQPPAENRTTKFGRMACYELPFAIAPDFELMTFHKPGSSHTHERDEVAACLAGCGSIVMVYGGMEIRQSVEADDVLVIPANVPHWMEPHVEDDPLQPFAFFIGYRALGD